MGYVSSVAQQQMSSRNNPYFDIDLKTSPSESERIRVVENSQLKELYFYKSMSFKVLLTLLDCLLQNLEFLFTIQILVRVRNTSNHCH